MEKNKGEEITVMPEILKLRAEFKRKFGDTAIFDEFYAGLKKKLAQATDEAVIGGKNGE